MLQWQLHQHPGGFGELRRVRASLPVGYHLSGWVVRPAGGLRQGRGRDGLRVRDWRGGTLLLRQLHPAAGKRGVPVRSVVPKRLPSAGLRVGWRLPERFDLPRVERQRCWSGPGLRPRGLSGESERCAMRFWPVGADRYQLGRLLGSGKSLLVHPRQLLRRHLCRLEPGSQQLRGLRNRLFVGHLRLVATGLRAVGRSLPAVAAGQRLPHELRRRLPVRARHVRGFLLRCTLPTAGYTIHLGVGCDLLRRPKRYGRGLLRRRTVRRPRHRPDELWWLRQRLPRRTDLQRGRMQRCDTGVRSRADRRLLRPRWGAELFVLPRRRLRRHRRQRRQLRPVRSCLPGRAELRRWRVHLAPRPPETLDGARRGGY
jgi:hypothetical protein